MNVISSRLAGVIYALITMLLWATLGIGLKTAVTRLDNFDATFHIGWLATLCLFLNILAKKKVGLAFREFQRQPVFFILAGILAFGVQQVIYLKAFAMQSAVQTVILYYIYPPMMVVLSIFIFREAFHRVAIVPLVVGFLGMIAVVTQGQLSGMHFGMGVLLVILAAACWAGFSVWTKHRSFDIETGMFLFSFFGMLFLACLVPVYGLRWREALPLSGLLVYLAVFPTAVAFLLWSNALRLIPTSQCAQIALMTPVFSTILIAIVLKEKIGLWHIVGLVCIVGAAWMSLRMTQAPEKSS